MQNSLIKIILKYFKIILMIFKLIQNFLYMLDS
jgi:hypothetical protein